MSSDVSSSYMGSAVSVSAIMVHHFVCVALFENDEGLWDDGVGMICPVQE